MLGLWVTVLLDEILSLILTLSAIRRNAFSTAFELRTVTFVASNYVFLHTKAVSVCQLGINKS